MAAITVFVNIIGQIVIFFYFEYDSQVRLLHADLMELAAEVELFFDPIATVLFFSALFWYERPIRRWLNAHFNGVETRPDLTILARRRLLNEVYFLIGINFFLWFMAAVIYTTAFWFHDAPDDLIFRAFYVPLISGLLVAILIFYFMDFVLQRWLVPIVFPDGGLHATPGVFRIRIRIRMVALMWACNFIPMLFFLLLPKRVFHSFPDDPAAAYEHLWTTITYHSIFFISIAILLAFLLAKNFLRPVLEIIRVIRGVNQGDLNQRVRVRSNDEIGFAGEVLNEMTHGLRERERLQDSVNLAMEVQQHLLPQHTPSIPGLDVAGRIVYCDETGGDYYDYIQRSEDKGSRLTVVIGDVSDHGVPSALLMATTRALIRRSCADSVPVEAVLSDVNGHLVQAVEDTGQFITLFIMEIDPVLKTVSWSNAGHEPALVYHPPTRSYSELRGKTMPALGVVDGYVYQESRRDLSPGEIIVLSTDGIWEAAGPEGIMFSRQALKSVVRAHAWMSAQEIVSEVITELRQFVHPLPLKDDATLVVVKMLERPGPLAKQPSIRKGT